MGWEIRVVLFAGSLLTLLFFLQQIRKNRLQIDYAVYWSVFAGALLFLSIFPGIISWASGILGFQSPSNLIYLVVIFLLLIKLFTTTIKLSKMNRQITDLAHHIALQETPAPNMDQEQENLKV